jgi:zinc transport system substrate-binding protein
LIPNNATFYLENKDKLLEKLDQLNITFKNGLIDCQQKDIITSHAAFGYLAKEYDLNQVAITGLSPDEEPSSAKLAQLTNFAKEKNIKYIFFESLVSPKLSNTLALEIGAKTLVLDPLEGLSDDDSKKGKDYFSKMAENLSNLRVGLDCQ